MYVFVCFYFVHLLFIVFMYISTNLFICLIICIYSNIYSFIYIFY